MYATPPAVTHQKIPAKHSTHYSSISNGSQPINHTQIHTQVSLNCRYLPLYFWGPAVWATHWQLSPLSSSCHLFENKQIMMHAASIQQTARKTIPQQNMKHNWYMCRKQSTLFSESFFPPFFLRPLFCLSHIPMKFVLKKKNLISISDALINLFSFAFLVLLSRYTYHRHINRSHLSFATYQPVQHLPFSSFLADTSITTNTSLTEIYLLQHINLFSFCPSLHS